MSIVAVFLVFSFVLAFLATIEIPSPPRFNLLAASLMFFVLSFLWPALVR